MEKLKICTVKRMLYCHESAIIFLIFSKYIYFYNTKISIFAGEIETS